MPQKTSIEWTRDDDGSQGYSSNPLRARRKDNGKTGWHCVKFSSGCARCYSEVLNIRFGTGLPYTARSGDLVELYLNEKELADILKLRGSHRVFVGDMTDLYQDGVTDAMLDRIFATFALARDHTFQVLTKRAERMREYLSAPGVVRRICTAAGAIHRERHSSDALEFSAASTRAHNASMKHWWDHVGRLTAWTHEGGCAAEKFERDEPGRDYPSWVRWPLPNVWCGVSTENQETADERIPHLLNTPAAVRFLSAEPLLGPIDLNAGEYLCETWRRGITIGTYLDLVICGGESGHGARPMHPDWARGLRDQCQESGVAYFFKQWGEWQFVYDRDVDDPDCRNCPKPKGDKERYVNLEGGYGFHGERVCFARRVGKKAAGRLLDGREWNEFPEFHANA